MKKLVSTDFSAENWLILGKKWSMMIATADKYGCRTLPMRNWHIIIHYIDHHHFLLVGHYLWGIDTSLFSDCTIFSSRCRTLPMRNWHMTPHTVPLVQQFRSDITYEELTQSLIHHMYSSYTPSPVGHYLWGIDTVCCFLKSCCIIRCIWWSDITYEELTLLRILIPHMYSCRTLPMRNWHNHSIPAHAHLHEH